MQTITIFDLNTGCKADLDALTLGSNTLPEAAKAKLRDLLSLAEKNVDLLKTGKVYRYGQDNKDLSDLRRRLDELETAVDLALLMVALKDSGIRKAVVTYKGFGDEGGIDEVNLESDSCAGRECSLLLQMNYGHEAMPQFIVQLICQDLDGSLRSFTDGPLMAHFDHDEYQNGCGGRGSATFIVEEDGEHPAGTVILEHSDIIESTEDYTHQMAA